MAILETRKPLDWSYERIKLLVLANLLGMATDIYGDAEAKEGLVDIEGEEFVLDFPTLGGAIVLKPQGNRLLASVGESEDPTSRFIFKIKQEKIFDVLEQINTKQTEELFYTSLPAVNHNTMLIKSNELSNNCEQTNKESLRKIKDFLGA